MKHFLKFLILLAIFNYSDLCFGQNLIPNPGFEIHDTCPNTTAQVKYCNNWEVVLETPDYFNSCTNAYYADVPDNYFGYQSAHSGCAYSGVCTYEGSLQSYREIMQSKLDTSLIIGTKYFISFYINLADKGWCSGTNKFGCRLTTNPYSLQPNGNPPINNLATFYTDSIVTDTANWTKISGSFIADSAYSYISFGNFFDDVNTQYINLVGSGIIAYYYIDDVCLSSDSLTCISVTNACYTPNGIEDSKYKADKIFPNPFSDQLTFELAVDEVFEILIYDLTSRKIFNQTFRNKISINTAGFSKGVYFYEIRNRKGVVKNGKMVKE